SFGKQRQLDADTGHCRTLGPPREDVAVEAVACDGDRLRSLAEVIAEGAVAGRGASLVIADRVPRRPPRPSWAGHRVSPCSGAGGFALERLRHALPEHPQGFLLVLGFGALTHLAAVDVHRRVPEAASRIAVDAAVASHVVPSPRSRLFCVLIVSSFCPSRCRSASSMSAGSVIRAPPREAARRSTARAAAPPRSFACRGPREVAAGLARLSMAVHATECRGRGTGWDAAALHRQHAQGHGPSRLRVVHLKGTRAESALRDHRRCLSEPCTLSAVRCCAGLALSDFPRFPSFSTLRPALVPCEWPRSPLSAPTGRAK